MVELTLLLEDLQRSLAAIIETAEARPFPPWLQAAAAVARGEHGVAADRLAALRTPPLGQPRASARPSVCLRTAAARRPMCTQKALAFYRSVGATRYIREGEALLAETA